jgi:hypothetical protein
MTTMSPTITGVAIDGHIRLPCGLKLPHDHVTRPSAAS